MSELIYKLVDREAWQAARADGAYAGSAVDLADGYIHMSATGQLAETARRHYAGRRDLLLVAVDPARLGEALKWEASRGGDLFPHLYAELPVSVAVGERALAIDAEGVMKFEDGAVGWP